MSDFTLVKPTKKSSPRLPKIRLNSAFGNRLIMKTSAMLESALKVEQNGDWVALNDVLSLSRSLVRLIEQNINERAWQTSADEVFIGNPNHVPFER